MGVYIKGMEMPTEGYIDVRIKCNGTASFAIAKNPYFKAVEAVSIPEPHGRLIDADAFKRYCQIGMEDNADLFHDEYKAFAEELTAAILQDIDEQPTIIPASEED